MRALTLIGSLLPAILVAAAAGSAPLNWEGTVVHMIGDFPDAVTTGGGIATVNSSSGIIPASIVTLRLAEDRGNLRGASTVPIDPEQEGLAGIQLQTTFGTGTFASIDQAAYSFGSLVLDQLPVFGVARVCLLSPGCAYFVDLPLVENGTRGVGLGGQIVVSQPPIRISIEAAPWTLKQVSVTDQIFTEAGEFITSVTRTAAGFIHDPASFSHTEAAPSGVVQLVTPIQITTNLTFGTNARIGWIDVLTVHFVPEPGALLSLGSAIAGLAVLGRIRARSRRRR